MNEKDGRSAKLRAGFEALVAQAGDDARTLAALSVTALKAGQADRGYQLARRARELAPDNAEIASLTHRPFTGLVPDWHFSIVRDDTRNQAYEAALKRAVGPGTRVLDIGTGTGILSMMAARAGAAHVTACDMNPAVADAAVDVIARNGLSDRIRVISKRSDALDVDADMGGQADVLVSEIVSNDMLGEHALAAMADAVPRLVKPQGRVIPAAGQVRIAAAWWGGLERRRMGETSGFDLSPFNRLDRTPVHLKAGDADLVLRGPAQDLFDFDFASGGPYRDERTTVALTCEGGPVNGLAQWIRLQMDEEGVYENAPAAGAKSCWAVLFYPLPETLYATGGQVLTVHGAHDRTRLRIWTDTAQRVDN
ncbi:MAG: 50S ribosomal protein L11 methyltransferase [Brevundimonas sp.]|uniref:50S ribosomal protein L11 methyltransferase n=2 Tax=Brevundimonas sp. TaxID=1871086 RepID=UPI002AB95864|nr:50S ribosomal protein L11 methyltransferase [Brevundimonas sp.]MDZ4109858.1 50S ribosomal protein L11 methyltransferase [Brevundimonas sp.]